MAPKKKAAKKAAPEQFTTTMTEPAEALHRACPECGEPRGSMCRTAGGVPVPIHRARVVAPDVAPISNDIPDNLTTPLEVVHRRRGDAPLYKARGGVITITLPRDPKSSDSPPRIEIEAYIRSGYPDGLMIRGLDTMLDLQLDCANVVIVKPRP
jgi:hypothetical protein